MTNAEKIKSGLRDKGFTQANIAKMLGVTPVSVHDVISGKRRTPRIRLAISMAIGRPASEIWPENKDQQA